MKMPLDMMTITIAVIGIVFVIILAACAKQTYIQPKAVTFPEEATVLMAVPVIPDEVIDD